MTTMKLQLVHNIQLEQRVCVNCKINTFRTMQSSSMLTCCEECRIAYHGRNVGWGNQLAPKSKAGKKCVGAAGRSKYKHAFVDEDEHFEEVEHAQG